MIKLDKRPVDGTVEETNGMAYAAKLNKLALGEYWDEDETYTHNAFYRMGLLDANDMLKRTDYCVDTFRQHMIAQIDADKAWRY